MRYLSRPWLMSWNWENRIESRVVWGQNAIRECIDASWSLGPCCIYSSRSAFWLRETKYSWLHICNTSGWCQCNSSPSWEQLWKGVLQRLNKDHDSIIHGQHSSYLILDCHSITIWAILPVWTPPYELQHDQNLLTTLTSCPPTTLETLIFPREANIDCSD